MHNDALLIDLYGCAGEPSRWPLLLDRLCAETGACSAIVQAFAFDGEGVRVGWQAMDTRTSRNQFRPEAQLEAADNPRLDRRRGLRGLQRIVRDDELFDADDPAREQLKHRLARIGMGHFMGTLQPLSDGRYLGIALHRAIDEARDFGAAQSSRLEHLAPHFRQACELAGEMRQARSDLELLQHHLDGLSCGLLVCDRDARVRWLNRRAAQLTETRSELQVQAGRLRTHRPEATDALHALMARAQTAPRFMALGDGPQALHLALRSSCDSVMIAITRGSDTSGVPPEAWSTLLGVTRAEALLVAALTAGATLEQHAQRRGVSLGTVRGQLKQVLAKTGTNRQTELMRLAMSSAAAHVLASVPELGC